MKYNKIFIDDGSNIRIGSALMGFLLATKMNPGVYRRWNFPCFISTNRREVIEKENSRHILARQEYQMCQSVIRRIRFKEAE
jgi:hypothetical protein